jgi:hypothetical protein
MAVTDPINASNPWWYNFFVSYKFFTMQTNFMVLLWFSLAIISFNKPILKKLVGMLRGAFTLYITVTFLVFAIFLSFLYQPTGFAAFSNLVLHYITPIAFIIDWFFTEKTKYKWKYLIFWLIYPLCYLIFAMIHGTITGDYLYPFLNIIELGVPMFSIMIAILVVIFIGLSTIYIGVNRKWLNKED